MDTVYCKSKKLNMLYVSFKYKVCNECRADQLNCGCIFETLKEIVNFDMQAKYSEFK